jgi:capsular polysaccharide biosynthesis protein
VETAAVPSSRRPVRHRTLLLIGVAVVVGIVGAVIAAAAVAAQAATYQSVATMAIDQPRAIAASGDAGVVAKLSALRSKYTGLATTQVFAEPIAQRLGLNPNFVRSKLFAQAPVNSLLILVGAQTGSRQQSRALAEAAATELNQYVQTEQEQADVPQTGRFTITEVSPAGFAAKVSPTNKRIAAAGGLAGLLVFAAVFAALSLRGRGDD